MNPIALPEKNGLLHLYTATMNEEALLLLPVWSWWAHRCSDINLNKSQCYPEEQTHEWKTIDCFLKEKISIFLIIPLFHFTHTFVAAVAAAVNHHR